MRVQFPADKVPRPKWFDNYRWIPWAIIGSLLVVVAVNGGLVYFALASWPGLTNDHAYSSGLKYNNVLDEAAKEARLGWKLEIDFVSDGAGTHSGKLAVAARDKDGHPLEGLSFRVELIRPIEQMAPVPVTLRAGSNGHYVSAVTLPRPGQWDVYLVAERDGQVYRTGRRILAP
jgi:nitrogen fixation protein FixH